MGLQEELMEIYEVLNGYFGDLHWWPADSPFEVIVGAILTQNTAWTNVEKAIQSLRRNRLLDPVALFSLPEEELADIIRPSGYYRLKASRLKSFIQFLIKEYSGNIDAMQDEDLFRLRRKLLGIKGIGPETADSILLYAFRKPIFVSDAYTKRIFVRHGIIGDDAGYDSIQSMIMEHLPHDISLFSQFHALIVNTGKSFCRKEPRCMQCPLLILRT